LNQENKAQSGFAQFDLRPEIMQGIEAAGFTVPSPIQVESIPPILAGRDVIAQAQTGTGKTAAFGLPLMSRLLPSDGVAILVIAPTRELAVQVADEMFALGKLAGAKTAAVYGGSSAREQIGKVQRGANIIAGTPGRLLDLMSSGRIKPQPSAVVLDEADRMLDMGFQEDIEQIFGMLPKERQTLLFSATLPERIQKLSQSILKNPVRIKTESTETAARIRQKYYVVTESEREAALIRLIDAFPPERAIVFCRTKRETDELSVRLTARGVQTRAIHGDMEQNKREQVLRSFRQGSCKMLVATDVAARGLDVQGITHVFNYHIPFDGESYTHRIGRTGRAGMEGLAATLVTPGEMRTWRRMMRETGGRSEFSTLPTLSQVKSLRAEQLLARIEEAQADESYGRLVEKLEAKMTLREAVLKLLSLLGESGGVDGPDQIGKNAQEAEQMGRDTGAGKGGKSRFTRGKFRKDFSSAVREYHKPSYGASGGKRPRSEGAGKFAEHKPREKKDFGGYKGEKSGGYKTEKAGYKDRPKTGGYQGKAGGYKEKGASDYSHKKKPAHAAAHVKAVGPGGGTGKNKKKKLKLKIKR
jgi:ATP-dependent RNA helicase DeaD